MTSKPEGDIERSDVGHSDRRPLGKYTEYDGSGGNPMRQSYSGKGAKLTEAEFAERVRAGRENAGLERVRKARRWGPAMSVARLSVTAVCAVGVLAIGGYYLSTASGYDQQVVENNEAIARLNNETDQRRDEMNKVASADALEQSMRQAGKQAGVAVAKQIEMTNLNITQETRFDDPALKRYGKLVDEMRPLFATGVTTGGDFLPHGQWYRPYELRKTPENKWQFFPIPGDRWTWAAVSLRDVNRDGTIPVLWEARFTGGEAKGRLLAWVTGKYNPDTGKLSEMRRGLTDEGRKHVGAEVASGAESQTKGKRIDGGEPIDENKAREQGEEAVRLAEEGRRKAKPHSGSDDHIPPRPQLPGRESQPEGGK